MILVTETSMLQKRMTLIRSALVGRIINRRECEKWRWRQKIHICFLVKTKWNRLLDWRRHKMATFLFASKVSRRKKTCLVTLKKVLNFIFIWKSYFLDIFRLTISKKKTNIFSNTKCCINCVANCKRKES